MAPPGRPRTVPAPASEPPPPVRKGRPQARRRAPALKADPERFPDLTRHPALERALRIRQAMLQGHPREEAVALAQQAMGERAPAMGALPAAARRPARPAKGKR